MRFEQHKTFVDVVTKHFKTCPNCEAVAIHHLVSLDCVVEFVISGDNHLTEVNTNKAIKELEEKILKSFKGKYLVNVSTYVTYDTCQLKHRIAVNKAKGYKKPELSNDEKKSAKEILKEEEEEEKPKKIGWVPPKFKE